MLVNAVSELPAIVINNIYELSDEVDKKSIVPKEFAKESISVKNGENGTVSKDKKLNKNEVNYKDLANKLKSVLKNTDLSIEFSMDEDVNKMIMKLIDEKKDEVVQQFPPEIAIKIAKIVASTLGAGQVTDARIWWNKKNIKVCWRSYR